MNYSDIYACYQSSKLGDSNPCQNNATCSTDAFGLNCQCAPGYSGKFCQQSKKTVFFSLIFGSFSL